MSKTLKECTWFAQLQTNKFQGLFKDKLQFSRTKIYSINRPSLTPFWTPYWLKHVMESVICNFYFFSHGWSHYFILLSTTKLWKMTGYDLQLHLRYRNSIKNKETKLRYCSCSKMFLDKVVNFKNFSRPNKEIKYFLRTLTEFKNFSRQLLHIKTFSR